MLEQLVGPGELKFEIRQQSEGVGGRWRLDVLGNFENGTQAAFQAVFCFYK